MHIGSNSHMHILFFSCCCLQKSAAFKIILPQANSKTGHKVLTFCLTNSARNQCYRFPFNMYCVVGKNCRCTYYLDVKLSARLLHPMLLSLFLTCKIILPQIYIFVNRFFYILLKNFIFLQKKKYNINYKRLIYVVFKRKM